MYFSIICIYKYVICDLSDACIRQSETLTASSAAVMTGSCISTQISCFLSDSTLFTHPYKKKIFFVHLLYFIHRDTHNTRSQRGPISPEFQPESPLLLILCHTAHHKSYIIVLHRSLCIIDVMNY